MQKADFQKNSKMSKFTCGKTCGNCGKLEKHCAIWTRIGVQPVENFLFFPVKSFFKNNTDSTICTKRRKKSKIPPHTSQNKTNGYVKTDNTI